MKLKNITSKIAISLLFFSSTIMSQVDNSDFAIWSSVGVDYSPIKRIKLGVDQHLRLKEDASVTDEYFTDVYAEFEIFKDFEIGGGARFSRENDNVGKKQGYEKHFRFNIDASFKNDIDRFTLSYRLRYQNKKEQDVEAGKENLPKENIRFKLGLDYNINNWPLDPEFSVEMYSDLENVDQVRDLSLSKLRITFGTDYKLKKIGKFGIYYRYEENIIPYFQNKTTSILGVSYSYSIN